MTVRHSSQKYIYSAHQNFMVTEFSLCTACSAPVDVTVTGVDETTVSLVWMEPEIPNGIISNYMVSVG